MVSVEEIGAMNIAELLHAWPSSAQIFMRYRMSCPGCLMAPFMTVDDAAREYDMEPAVLRAVLVAHITETAEETER